MAMENATHVQPYDAAAWMNDTALDTVQQSCATHKTCDDCLAASYACHFCEFDFQCHAIGSPLGCIKGISTCHHLTDCERETPQHVGYGPPPSVVIAVLCLVVTLTCCLCGMSAICSVFIRTKKRRAEQAAAAKEKKSQETKKKQALATVDEQLSPSQTEPLLSEDTEEQDELLSAYEENVDSGTIARMQRRRLESDRVSFNRVLFRLIWIGGLIGITVLALMFYPRMPDYNVCNREFEWESIFQSLRSLSPKIEYDVLISVINENRFGFVLTEGSADIYHNQTWVGSWHLNQSWEATAGAITDVVAPLKLDPGYTEALSLWSDFRNNALIFRLNASITGYITWGKHKVYRISSSVSDIEFLVGAEYDRGLCKCTEYLEPQ